MSSTSIHCRDKQVRVDTLHHATLPNGNPGVIGIDFVASTKYVNVDGVLYGGDDDSACLFVNRDQQTDIALGLLKGMDLKQIEEIAEHCEWMLAKKINDDLATAAAVTDAAIERVSCG